MQLKLKEKKKIIGSSLEASTELTVSKKIKNYLNDINLNDLFIVSSAKIVDKLSGDTFSLAGINDTKVKVKKSDGLKCERCWVISKEINNKNLCKRCQSVIRNE